MGAKRQTKPDLTPWDVAALVLAGLLFLNELAFLILALAGAGRLFVYCVQCAFVLGVLLLLGLLLYGLGKGRGMGRLARRLLLGGLTAGTALFFLFALAVGALVLFAAS